MKKIAFLIVACALAVGAAAGSKAKVASTTDATSIDGAVVDEGRIASIVWPIPPPPWPKK